MPPLDPDILCLDKRRRGPKPLSVRAQFAATSWLDGTPVWQNGRVVWRHHDRVLEVGPRELDAVSRALAALQRHPKTARRHCAHFDEWLFNRLAAHERASQLAAIRAPDLETLVSHSRRRNPAALKRLAQLLAVEASVDALPASAAQALFEAWPHSAAPLQHFLSDESQLLPARALAALIIGAASPYEALPGQPFLRRTARYGVRFGFPKSPRLCIALLENNRPDLENSVQGVLNSLESGAPFAFDATQLLALHRTKNDAALVAAWAKAAVDLADPFFSLSFAPVAPKRLDLEAERTIFQHWNQLRQECIESLRQRLVKISQNGEPSDFGIVAGLFNHLISAPTRALGAPKIERNRLPRRRERNLPPFQNGIQEAAAIVLEILDVVAEAPHPSELLQILHEAILESSACPAAENLSPPAWASRWSSYLSSQRRELMVRLRLAQRMGIASTRRAVKLKCQHRLKSYLHLEPALLNYALDLMTWAPSGTRDIIWRLDRFSPYWKGVTDAQAALSPIIKGLNEVEPKERLEWLSDLLNAVEGSRRGACQLLPALAPFLPAMLRADKAGGEKFPRWALVDSVLILRSTTPIRDHASTLARFDWLADEMGRRWKAAGESKPSWGNVEELVGLAAQLAGEEEDKFRRFLDVGWSYIGWDSDTEWGYVKRGLRLMRKLPRIETTLADNFARCPQRCLNLLEKLGPLDNFESIRIPLEIWHQRKETVLDESWQFLDAFEDLPPWATRFANAKRELREDQVPPPSLLKIAAWPQKLATEIEALKQREELTSPQAKRLDNLVSRLCDGEKLKATMRQEMSEALQNATWEAELRAARRIVHWCYRVRLESLGMSPGVRLDADLHNAALLSTDIESNRKWLREIILAHCENRTHWREEIAGNSRWLQTLSQKNCNPAHWLAENPQSFLIGYQNIELGLESNPLKILHMGNYFGTCLSWGGCNSFSSVANAVELNKRVVFARDAKGRVVGRQLLALSTENKLLGFRVYVSLEKKQAAQLRHAFGTYAREFAARCGVELADNGEVERLFVSDWWDDGCIDWSDLDYVEPKSKKKSTKEVKS